MTYLCFSWVFACRMYRISQNGQNNAHDRAQHFSPLKKSTQQLTNGTRKAALKNVAMKTGLPPFFSHGRALHAVYTRSLWMCVRAHGAQRVSPREPYCTRSKTEPLGLMVHCHHLTHVY